MESTSTRSSTSISHVKISACQSDLAKCQELISPISSVLLSNPVGLKFNNLQVQKEIIGEEKVEGKPT